MCYVSSSYIELVLFRSTTAPLIDRVAQLLEFVASSRRRPENRSLIAMN